jgi:hypothetical protein
MTDQQRLAALEQQAAKLNAEIAALKAGKAAPLSPPPKDEGVRIGPVLAERVDGMPDLREMERLYAAVRNLSPWPQALVDRYDDGRPFRAFSVSFRWLMNVPRADRPNGKVALSYWLETCRAWLRARNAMTADLNANALILATFAVGDVCYCPADPQLGVTWEIGLLEFGGRPASPDAWKRILAQGAAAVLPPSAPARRVEAPSQVRIYGGW